MLDSGTPFFTSKLIAWTAEFPAGDDNIYLIHLWRWQTQKKKNSHAYRSSGPKYWGYLGDWFWDFSQIYLTSLMYLN